MVPVTFNPVFAPSVLSFGSKGESSGLCIFNFIAKVIEGYFDTGDGKEGHYC